MKFEGTASEVLRRMWNSAIGVEAKSELSRTVAAATGVVPQTASTWLRSVTFPKGVTRVRLLVYLADDLGHFVKEFEDLDDRLKILNRILARNVLDLDDLTMELDYCNTQEAHRLLRGDISLIRGVDARVEDVIRRYGDELKGEDLIKAVATSAAVLNDPQPQATTPPQAANGCGDIDAQVLRAAGLLLQILPDLEALVLYGDSRQHEQLRKLVGPERFVHSSNLHNALTGPRPMERFLTEHNRRKANR